MADTLAFAASTHARVDRFCGRSSRMGGSTVCDGTPGRLVWDTESRTPNGETDIQFRLRSHDTHMQPYMFSDIKGNIWVVSFLLLDLNFCLHGAYLMTQAVGTKNPHN